MKVVHGTQHSTGHRHALLPPKASLSLHVHEDIFKAPRLQQRVHQAKWLCTEGLDRHKMLVATHAKNLLATYIATSHLS
jgi:hypothetical protein